MPPRCFPPEPIFEEKHRAERTVWEALRDQLPDEACLFHSVSLIDQAREYEADLIVAWPGLGVAVIEVKGGSVACRDRAWTQNGRSIGSPVVQAQDCRHALTRYLTGRSSPAARARITHLVAFPATPVSADWQAPDCTRDMVIDRRDLTAAADVVRRAIDTHGSGHQPLDDAACESLVNVLEGQLLGQQELLSQAEVHEQRVDQMTRDQVRALDSFRYHTRLKVIGGAGSGKTWLALEQARRLARNGERVALVCYSRGLGRFLQRMTEMWPSDQRPAYVGLFHDLAVHWGAPDHDDDAPAAYWEEGLARTLGELAAARAESERFDAIVVDEAQDFSDLWWPPMLACLRDADNGGLFAFFDPAQDVFARSGQVPIDLPPFVLNENIRNTKNIAEVFGGLSGEQMRYRGLPGPPVRFHNCVSAEALSAADDMVDALLEEGWEAGDIALLTTHHRHPLQKEVIDYGGFDGYWDAFFAGDVVFYGHVLGFKGLERPVVVLAVNGFKDPQRARQMLYVGLSRARTLLVVCGDLDQIAQAGGDGVRRRLQKADAV